MTTPVSRVLAAASAAEATAARAIQFAESSNRIYHGLYEKQRDALAALTRRVGELERLSSRDPGSDPV